MIINKSFEKPFFDESEILILFGGRGSGKSFFSAQKMLTRIITEYPHRMLCVHKYERKLKETVYQQLKEIISIEKLEDDFEFRVSPLQIIYKKNGNVINFFGLDGPKIKSVTSLSGIIWLEEATFLTEEDFSELYLSVRGEHQYPVQFILTFNPIDHRHWLNKRFFVDKVYPASIYKTTYKDNPFVGDNYEAKLDMQQHNQSYYRMAKYGEWGTIDDAIIFNNWEVVDVNKDFTFYDDVVLGVDWGFNHPMACVMVGLKDANVYIMKEISYTQKNDNEFIKDIKKEFPNHLTVTAGHERPGSIQLLNDVGLTAKRTDVNKYSIMEGINYLRRNKIYVDSSCKKTIEELQVYQFKKDRFGEATEDPLKINDDCISAIRYALDDYITTEQSAFQALDVFM